MGGQLRQSNVSRNRDRRGFRNEGGGWRATPGPRAARKTRAEESIRIQWDVGWEVRVPD